MVIQVTDVAAAMQRCTEGFVTYVIDSIEFDIGRKLSDSEAQIVNKTVENAIDKVTTEMELSA